MLTRLILSLKTATGHSPVTIAILITLASSSMGCGLLLGTVKPVSEKSTDYGIEDLSSVNPDWAKLQFDKIETMEAQNQDAPQEATAISDVAYQSEKTASIISLNSSCRASAENQEKSLKDFTRLLLLGISDVSMRTEREIKVQGAPALETTIQGRMNGEIMMLRTVVLRRQDCVYDLMYVSRPQHFPTHEGDFTRFVGSLRIK